jgi:hypothetical protein
MKANIDFFIITHLFLLRMRNVSNKTKEKMKSYILCSETFFKNRAVYMIMRKNSAEPDRPQMTIWHVCNTCWITKATETPSEDGIFIAFLLQQWLHKHTSMLHNMYIAYLVCSVETTTFFVFICMFVKKKNH